MTFSERFGYVRPGPPRVQVERDSDDLRIVLWEIVTLGGPNYLRAYHELCGFARQLPDANIFSDRFAEERARSLLEDLHWTQVYEALETEFEKASQFDRARIQHEVNRALDRSGLAYEMRDGQFELLDPEADALGIRHSEREALTTLTDEFAAVHVQYAKALAKLHAIPADYEGALSDALNSLEAVAKIVTGDLKATLSSVAPKLFLGGEGYHVPLRVAIEKLYAYSNQLPGGRHGRYAEPTIAYAETVMVVRIVGAIISFLVADYRDPLQRSSANFVW